MKYRFLIFGGTGYIGNNLKKSLGSYSILTTGYNSKNSDIKINLRDKKTFDQLKGHEFEIVILLAADVYNTEEKKLSSTAFKTNTYFFGTFLEHLCSHNKISKILYFSSMSVYESPVSSPDEKSFLYPSNSYGLSKKLGEDFVKFLSSKYGINSLILRIPGVYGNERKSGLIYNCVFNATFNKDIFLSLDNNLNWECIEINDLIDIILKLLKSYSWEKKAQILNLGYGEPMNIVTTANYIIKFIDSKSKIKISKNNCHFFNMNIGRLKTIIKHESNFKNSLKRYSLNISNELHSR